MKKWILFLLVVGLLCNVGAAVRINEVSPGNPEYIELYNESSAIELINWIIADDNSNDTFSLNISANGFALIVDNSEGCSNYSVSNGSCFELATIGSGLNDGGDGAYLYDNNSILIDSMNWTSSTSSESWQYCSGNFMENPSTPGSSNNCTTPSSPPTPEDDPDPSIVLEWDEEDIINGEEFDIKIVVEGLDEDEYHDVMVWIVKSNDCDDSSISERYGNYSKDEIKWADGKKWAYAFLEEGDESEKIKIRIDESESDFKGGGRICAKLREFDDNDVLDEWNKGLEILESEDAEEDENDDEVISTPVTTTTTGSAIKLGSTSSSSEKGTDVKSESSNSIIYKSKNEYIKEWSVYAFAFICIGIIVLLLIERR